MDEPKKKRKIYYTENRKKTNAKWDKANLKSIGLRFRIVEDADILEHLETVPNKRDYIRQLIRDDINKNTD